MVYNLESKLCFSEFLHDFESYFERQYYGSQRDCSRVLGRYLEGEILDVYTICGGEYSKYSDVKSRMLQWYESVKWLKKYNLRREFEEIKLKGHSQKMKNGLEK